jgi:hypothetical protein
MLAEGYSYKARAAALDIGMDTYVPTSEKSTSSCTCTRSEAVWKALEGGLLRGGKSVRSYEQVDDPSVSR